MPPSTTAQCLRPAWIDCPTRPTCTRTSFPCRLPERAYIVKCGLCGFCRLGLGLFVLCVQTLYAIRRCGLFSHCSDLTIRFVVVATKLVQPEMCVTIPFARSVRSFFSMCDRASIRPFVDARGPSVASALGRYCARHRKNLFDRPAGLQTAP